MIAVGHDVERLLHITAERLGRQILVARIADDTLWAWLGGRTPCAAEKLKLLLGQRHPVPELDEKDGGRVKLATARAYLDCDCNAASAATVLKVDRRTIEYRISTIEAKLKQPRAQWRVAMALALSLYAPSNQAPFRNSP